MKPCPVRLPATAPRAWPSSRAGPLHMLLPPRMSFTLLLGPRLILGVSPFPDLPDESRSPRWASSLLGVISVGITVVLCVCRLTLPKP